MCKKSSEKFYLKVKFLNGYEQINIMEKTLKTIITNFHEKGLPPLIERKIPLNHYLINNVAKVIVGPRRAGKTYLMFQIMKYLKKPIEDYIYIDFEDNRLAGFTSQNFEDILSAYYSLYPNKTPILFLDEVHNVKGWELFVRRLLNEGYDVYVSGSNANLLSKEYATKLAGRYVEIPVFPLSFKEFIKFKGIEINKNIIHSKRRFVILKTFDEYMRYGGFPKLVNLSKEQRLMLLKTYYQTTILRDVMARYKITDINLIDTFIKKLTENITNPYSFNSIVKNLKNMGIETNVKTLSTYYKYLEEVFFVLTSKVKKESFLKRHLERKTYLVDNGYLNLFYINENLDKRLENTVATELFKREKCLFYYKNAKEVDFVFKGIPIQVTYELGDNRQREVESLSKYMELKGKKKGYILTYNQEETIKVHHGTIYVEPAWKFFLGI